MEKEIKHRYPLRVEIKLFKQFRKKAKKEHKLVNQKLVELVLNYVNEGKKNE